MKNSTLDNIRNYLYFEIFTIRFLVETLAWFLGLGLVYLGAILLNIDTTNIPLWKTVCGYLGIYFGFSIMGWKIDK